MLEGALRWLTRQVDAPAAVRRPSAPAVAAIGNAASISPRGQAAAGSLLSIFGSNLTSGSALAGSYSHRLAGTAVRVNGNPLKLLFAGPGQINGLLPSDLRVGSAAVEIDIRGAPAPVTVPLAIATAVPGVFAATPLPGAIVVWATGLGTALPSLEAQIDGVTARILYAGPSPEWPGLDQINVEVSSNVNTGIRRLVLRLTSSNEPFYSGQVIVP
jgi:hypothetical protein